MRILFATGIYPPDIGGPASYTDTMNRRLEERGYKVTVVTYGEAIKGEQGIFRVSRTLPPLVRHIAYAWKVFRAGVGADIIYVQDSFSAGLPVLLANLFLRKPIVLKVVGDYAWEQGQSRFGVKDSLDAFQKKQYGFAVKLLRTFSRAVARRVDRIITPSLYLKKIVQCWGIEQEYIKVIYNAVHLPKVRANGLEKRPNTILSVGRLVPWKGFEELIFAMREVRESVKDAQLIIVGDGPERSKLENLILEQGLEAVVHLPGRVPHDELPELYATSAGFILNTSYEGFSHQLIEVMASGLPIATTGSGGNAELCRNDENAILFPVNDITAIRDAMLRLLTDKQFAHALVSRAWEDAQQFGEERMVEETIDFFKDFVFGERVGIVSLDNSLLDADSPSFRRMINYAEKTNGLGVIVLHPGKKEEKFGTLLKVVRFGGTVKAQAFWAGFWQGRSFFKKFRPKVISSQDPFFAGLLGLIFAKSCGAKFIAELHGDFWPEDKKLWPGFARNFMAKIILRRADVIRVVSEKVKAGLLNFDKKLTGKQIEVFPIVSGEANMTFFARPQEIVNKWPANSVRALFIGRLVKEKGLDWFLPVFKLACQEVKMHLLIVGNGPEKQNLIEQVNKLDLQSLVSFEDFVSEHLLPEYYTAADFMVMPSRQESWGRVVIEAMQNGCPVIATREVGAAHDLLKNGENALVVPFGNDETIKSALIRMAADRELRKRLGEAGKISSQGLSFTNMVDKMTGLWKSV